MECEQVADCLGGAPGQQVAKLRDWTGGEESPRMSSRPKPGGVAAVSSGGKGRARRGEVKQGDGRAPLEHRAPKIEEVIESLLRAQIRPPRKEILGGERG